ncbi:MAG: hypothetical protein R2777_06040 [Chitinophagales bacterium]
MCANPKYESKTNLISQFFYNDLFSYSQNTSQIDSLKQELSNYHKQDSLRFELLIETFRLEFKQNLDSETAVSRKAHLIAKTLKNKDLKLRL